MSGRVGSLAWGNATGGRLRARDRIALLSQGVLFQAGQMPAKLGDLVGLGPRRHASLELDRVRIPDTQAAREAEQLCAQMRPELLINHCYRTFLWATALGRREGVSYDEELVYVSSLLHDLGLSTAHRRRQPSCFTLIGAAAAADAAADNDWSEERGQKAAAAIVLHLNARLADENAEARLMAAGTLLDTTGTGLRLVAGETAKAVLARYPRDDLAGAMRSLFDWQLANNPGSRAHFYCRYLGLKRRFTNAPFEG